MTGPFVSPSDGEAIIYLRRRRATDGDFAAVAERDLAQALRIRHEGRRAAFLAGRTLLRAVLAAMLGTRPDAIILAADPQGVLSVADVPPDRIRFNLSHGEVYDVLAVTRGIPVGIDIEGPAPPDRDGVAESVMTDTEFDVFRRLPAGERDEAFLRLWTRKEAALKAAGTGFLVEPRDVHVGVEPGEGFRPVTSAALPGGPWYVGDVSMPETACALAVDRASVLVRVLRL